MAKEYIEREAVVKELKEELDFESPMYTADQNKHIDIGLKIALRVIRKAPTADVVEVKHGRWIEKDLFSMYHKVHNCSECGEPVYDNGKPFNYCPNCGAKMDGGAEG